jgi:S1-C subfamily serine protease
MSSRTGHTNLFMHLVSCRRLVALSIVCSCLSGVAQGSPSVSSLEESLPVDAIVHTVSPPISPLWAKPKPPDNVVWERSVSHSGATAFIALHINIDITAPGHTPGWEIEIREDNGSNAKPIAVYNSKEFRSFGSKFSFWTPDVKGNKAKIFVRAGTSPPPLTLAVDQYATENITVPVKSIVDPLNPHILDITAVKSVAKYYNRAGSIAKVSAYHGQKRKPCTGFLIRDNIAVTNEHCIPAGIENGHGCPEIHLIFAYESDRTDSEVVYCRKLLKKSYPLDYAILELAGLPGKKHGSLAIENMSTPKKSEKLFIIQHPGGQHKKIVIQECAAGSIEVAGRLLEEKSQAPYKIKQDFEHTCDTEGGSSGSPIFNEEGLVVGIHHYGFDPASSNRWNQGVLGPLLWDEITTALPINQ